MSLLKNLIKLINTNEPGTIIQRQDLLTVDPTERRNSQTTIDTYRNYLTQAGYLSKENLQSGSYKVVRHIDENLTVSKLKTQAYP